MDIFRRLNNQHLQLLKLDSVIEEALFMANKEIIYLSGLGVILDYTMIWCILFLKLRIH
ncbi:hypothetical protein [Candidatus Erwinia haradaeae]|uniref:hypothetical protein n=1 Tax=Candidatus Erwinia haradaeae TaxID=1922217 RepID=UPI0013006FCF|nr:hypothetical protein [Candidatus Erwinia haradaeae]